MKASSWDNGSKEPCPRTQRSGHGRIRTEDRLIRSPTPQPIGHCAPTISLHQAVYIAKNQVVKGGDGKRGENEERGWEKREGE